MFAATATVSVATVSAASATHTLATIALVLEEIGIGRVIGVNKAISRRIAIDRGATNLGRRTRRTKNAAVLFTEIVVEVERIAADTTTGLLHNTTATTSCLLHTTAAATSLSPSPRLASAATRLLTVYVTRRPRFQRCSRPSDRFTRVAIARAATTLFASLTLSLDHPLYPLHR